MVNIKKSAYEAVIRKLKKDRDEIYFKIRMNKREINRLAEEQRTLKDEFNANVAVIRDITGKKDITR